MIILSSNQGQCQINSCPLALNTLDICLNIPTSQLPLLIIYVLIGSNLIFKNVFRFLERKLLFIICPNL